MIDGWCWQFGIGGLGLLVLPQFLFEMWLHDIVTFREKTSQIIRNDFKMPNVGDEEAQKRAI